MRWLYLMALAIAAPCYAIEIEVSEDCFLTEEVENELDANKTGIFEVEIGRRDEIRAWWLARTYFEGRARIREDRDRRILEIYEIGFALRLDDAGRAAFIYWPPY